MPDGAKVLLATVAHDPAAVVAPAYDAAGGHTAYIDFPRSLENDRNCYQISAIDAGGHEGSRTGELCLRGSDGRSETETVEEVDHRWHERH